MSISVHLSSPAPEAVAAILRGLEPWFGIEKYTREYIEAANRLPNYLACDDATGDTIGVILIERHFPSTAEIHLMAVKAHWHRKGVGRMLIREVEQDMRRTGIRIMSLKTLGPSRPNEGYDRTRQFYESMGYLPVEEFEDLWPENPCLLLVKPL